MPPMCQWPCGFAMKAETPRSGASARTCWARWRWRCVRFAILAALFAPAVMHVLAPGFGPADERLRLAVDFMRLSAPYIALSGAVAVAASALNAEGRVWRRRPGSWCSTPSWSAPCWH